MHYIATEKFTFYLCLRHHNYLSLTLSLCSLTGPVYTGMPLVDPVYTGITLGDPLSTCRVYWNTTGKHSLNCATLEYHWRNSDYCSLHWSTTEGNVAAHTQTQAYIVKQGSIHASLKWQNGGATSSRWTGPCKFSFWSLLLCNRYQFCSSNVWVLQHDLDMSTIYIKGCMMGSDLT